MQRSKALAILTRQIIHRCPYKGQDTYLATCYINAQDGEHEFCYGCDHIEKLKAKYGLKTFNRKVVTSSCRNCSDSASLHSDEPPHKSERDTRCPGFAPQLDDAKVYVPTNLECTEWMIVDLATGMRTPYAVARAKWDPNARRLQIGLLGAPGTVPSDSRDERRRQLAHEATKRRGRPDMVVLDDDGNEVQQTVRIKKGKKSK